MFFVQNEIIPFHDGSMLPHMYNADSANSITTQNYKFAPMSLVFAATAGTFQVGAPTASITKPTHFVAIIVISCYDNISRK